MASFCTMSDALGLVICVSDIIHDDAMLDSWSVHLTLYRMTACWTRDLCIWHYTWWRNVGLVICIWHYTWWRNVGLVTYVSDIIQNDVGLVICVSDIIQNGFMLDSWSVHLTLYRMTPCWTRDLCIWHYTGWRNEITSPTWRHSVQCQMHRSRVQHCVILYNVRYTDHESNVASFCIMLDKQVISPTWHHSV